MSRRVVMALDEDVLQDQIKGPRRASRRSLPFNAERLNFESRQMLMRSYRIASA